MTTIDLEDEETLEEQAQRVVKEERKDSEQTAEVDSHEDRTLTFRTTSFSRMRLTWHGEEGVQMALVRSEVDRRIVALFGDAYIVMNDLYAVVREQAVNEETGELLTDEFGFPVWAKRPDGEGFIEDYSRLGIKAREEFILRLTTGLFEWEQTAADLWGDAMFSKAIWEETFAGAFASNGEKRLTVDDRTQRAKKAAAEDRYFALYRSYISRRGDALVRSVTLLCQRIKDLSA